MVSTYERTISQQSTINNDDNYQLDTSNSALSTTCLNDGDNDDDDDNFGEYDGTIVLNNNGNNSDELPPFSQISVVNSSDVHFGNRTFYEGPVTIKQFLCTDGKVPCDIDSDGVTPQSEIVLDPLAVRAGLDNLGFLRNDDNKKELTGRNKQQQEEQAQDQLPKGADKFYKFFQENHVILVSFLAILMVSLAILMIVLLTKHSPVTVPPNSASTGGDDDEDGRIEPVPAPIDPTTNTTINAKLKLVSRLEWLAQPPVQPANHLKTPVSLVIVSHTASANCSSQAQCVLQVRLTQTFHIESRGWWDIGYNFLVGGDGEAYEGRGWEAEGAHTFGYNNRSLGIAFIGTFNTYLPTKSQIVAFQLLLKKGVELNYITKDYKLMAARQFQTTQSPGQALYDLMKTWNHWSKEP